MVDVRMPNGDVVGFPDDMPQEQIKGFIETKFGSQQQPAQQEQWRRGILAPIEKNVETGAMRPAWPQIAVDAGSALTLPGDAFRGEIPDLDPAVSTRDMSPETLDRISLTAGMITPQTVVRSVNPLAGMTAAQRRGLKNTSRALVADQVDLGDVNNQIRQMGPDAKLADIGTNTQQMAGGIAALPGEGRRIITDTLEARAKNVGPRVQRDVQKTFGVGDGYVQTLDDITKAQQDLAGPIYDAVMPQPITVDGNMQMVFNSDFGKRAVGRVDSILSARGQKVDMNNLTVEVADLIKRELDDMAKSSTSDRYSTTATAIQNQARLLREAVDKQVPDYAVARDAFAGHEAVKEALDIGRDIFSKNTDPLTFQRAMDAASISEREAMITGARTALEDAMGNAINDAAQVRNFLRKTHNRKKLETVLGTDAVLDLVKAMEREMTFGQTANEAIRNSRTASRLAAMAELDPAALSTPQGETVFGAVKGMFDKALNRVRGPLIRDANTAAARMLSGNQVDEAALLSINQNIFGSGPVGNALIRTQAVQTPAEIKAALERGEQIRLGA